tara:strand:- start:512 stop:733 length:222 start_codon:yes stop_codon:yes gene_type:complete
MSWEDVLKNNKQFLMVIDGKPTSTYESREAAEKWLQHTGGRGNSNIQIIEVEGTDSFPYWKDPQGRYDHYGKV